ncbi:MAG: S-layer homology domain-containing protein [Clostridia bacterium]|nr:S-layer homology domain-containing protein [Clostridia bacterium]
MKKKFFHYASLIVAIAMIFVCSVPAVYAADDTVLAFESAYEAETSVFTVKGKLPKTGKSYVNIIIAPYGKAVDSQNAIADESVIVKTVQSDVSGNVEVAITMPDGKLESRYSYYINTDTQLKSGVFSTAVASDLTAAAAAVNSADEKTMADVLKNNASALISDGDDIDYIADYVYSTKPQGGYDSESLADAYLTAEGLSRVADGDLGLGDFLSNYSQYLPEDYYIIYAELNDETQKAMEELYKEYPVEGSFDDAFNMYLFIAKYKGSESPADLQKIVLAYFEEIGHDLDDYYDIGNSVYQEKVFDNLYADRSKVDTLEDIEKAFDEEVEAQSDNAKDASDNSSGGSGGGGSGSKGGTTGSIGTVAPAVTPVSGIFADMADHWAKADVETMYARGIVSGFPDGSFRPGQNVTRAEFAKMIAVVLGLDTNVQADFDDVAASDWYAGYVAAAAKAGIVKGTSETTFEPEKYITRQDAAVMLARVLDYKGKAYPTASKGFNDEASIADYAKTAVNGLANLGLINGYNGGFAPVDNTTRAEAAALLLRVADYIK